MKSLKHLFILMLAVCFSSLLKAQCTAAFTDSVTGNTITVNATAQPVTGYAWYIDGTLAVAANPNTSFVFQNVLPGTHHICLWLYTNNTFLCDTVCQNVTVTSCGSLTAYWNSPAPVNDTVSFTAYDTISSAHHIWSFGDGTDGSGTTVTHVYSAPGTYTACFYSYIPGTSCSDSMCRSIVVPPASNACGVASFSSYILNDSTIRVYSTSTGAGDSSNYVWSVYNTSTGLVQSSSTGHTSYFLSNALPIGSYRVCLDLYNNVQVLCSSFCDTVQVLRCSSLNAAYTYTSSTANDTLKVAAPTNNPAGSTYAWTFGDASTSSYPGVTHIYSQSGIYSVCLVVSNPALTCHDTLCQSITIGNPNACGVASFSSYIVNDSTIRGYSTSTSTSDSSIYVWTVTYTISGIPVTETIPTGHTSTFLSGALAIGTYKVCLYLYNGQNVLCDSSCNSVQVLRCSSLSAVWTYTASNVNDTLKVNAPSNPSGTTYAWTFGDGTTSSLADPAHVYAQSGNYTVCLVVSNPALTCHDTLCQSITIGNPNACGTASYYYYVLNDSTILCYNNSTGASDSSFYVWNVYGSNGNLVQTSSTGHTGRFLSNGLPIGNYKVCLDLYNAQNVFCDSFCNTIQVLRCSSISAAWQYSASANTDSVNFIPVSEPSGTTYAWTLGDGTTASYSTFSHTYAQSGTYNVCLIVSNPALTCHDTLCQSITVGNPNACGTASFSYYVLNDSTIRCYSTSTGTSDSSSYQWLFTHTVSGLPVLETISTGHTNNVLTGPMAAGTYTVCLYLYNAQGAFCDSTCQTVQVLRCSSLNAQYFYTVLTNDSVKFSPPTNNPSGSIYLWIFGDATSSTSTTVTHVYAQAGTYTACLIVSNPSLTCRDTVCQSITATGSNCGSLTAYWNFPTPVNDTVRFTAYDTISTAHHIWNFGDGTDGSGTTATHVYSAAGTYTVCFYSYIPGTTCSDSFCRSVVVPATTHACGTPLFSDYIYGDTSIHAYSTSTGTDSATLYGWTIKGANGNLIQSQTGSTNYIVSQHLSPGAYTVCLTLYQGNSLCDSICNTVVVPSVGACGTPSFADSVIAEIGGGVIHAYTTSTTVDSLSQYSWKIWGPNGGLVQTFTGGDFRSSTLDSGTYIVCQYIRATGSTYICDSICQTVVVGNSNPCAGLSAVYTYNLVPGTTDSIEFYAPAEPAGTNYVWDWYYAPNSPDVGVRVTQPNTYFNACLQVYIPNTTCRDTFCHIIYIEDTGSCPVAAFSDYVYGDTAIHAYSSSTGTTSRTVYNWRITNSAGVIVSTSRNTGTTSNFITPTLPNGAYNVCLLVSADSLTYCDSVCHTITIADTINPCGTLNASFATTHLSNGNVQFTEADSAAGVTHYWHFGDGTIYTGPNPVHAYAIAGLYHVCQYVFYAGSTCLDSFCINVQTGASGCSANFSTQGYYPPYNGVHFTNLSTSTDSIITYRWTFGDSTDATFASGDHVYPHSGTYYACLFIYAANGCTSIYCDTVNVSYNPCSGLSSTYTYTYTQSGGVHFAGSTSISNATNYWAFGDGTSATTFDPVHYYSQAGTYTVCHIVSIPGTLCSDTTCQSVQGTGVGTGCVASFTDSAYSNNNKTIIFTNTSTSSDSIVSYAWTFGDGAGSTVKNTYHVYTNSGTYYVCLTIVSANGCTNTHCDSVHVGTTTPPPCNASFTYTVDSCQVISFTSTSTGSLDFLRWIYGDGTTDTTYQPTHSYAQGGVYTVILHFYGNGCYNFDTAQITVPACGSGNDTVCGTVFDDLNGNGVQNTGEPGVASAEVHIGSYVTFTDSTGHYEVIVPAGTYTIYYCAPSGYAFSIPVYSQHSNSITCAEYQGVQVSSGSNCGYNFGIIDSSSTICGTVYFDANDNHVQDPGESGIPGAEVIFTNSGNVVYTCYTDQYGHYCAVLGAGNYVITIISTTYPNGAVYPGSITVNATAGGAFDNNNFGIYVAPSGCDLSINITPNTTITPGYPAWYQIQVCNVGSTVTSGTVNLFYDPSLKFNYGSPVPSSQNSTTFTASWDLTNLNPGSCQYYYVSLTTDSTDVAGQFIFTLANVTTVGCNDVNLANNVDTLHQTVTASWDPNNKQVSPEGNIYSNQWLTYTINFQNTGTAPAVNIVVQDTISANLDMSSFKALGASLPYTLQIAGNIAIWKFNSVSLPDSSTDQQDSHGFVSFMILPMQGLPGKSRITNQADIFFDYNAGVSTNQTLNTIDYPLSVEQIATDNVTITLQPNPFSQYTTIKIDGTDGPYQLNVYDMLGRVVKAQPAADNIFDVERGSLASGMYMYEILQQGKVIGKGKMIAQ